MGALAYLHSRRASILQISRQPYAHLKNLGFERHASLGLLGGKVSSKFEPAEPFEFLAP